MLHSPRYIGAEDQIERVRQVEETPSRIKENEKEVETKEGAY